MGNINIEIPDEIHKKFKIKCIQEDKEIRQVINELIMVYIKNINQKKGVR